MNLKSRYFVSILLLLLISTLYVFGQSDTSDTPKISTGAGGVFIAYLICSSMKRHAIGGWLLYFYMQLFGSALISLGLLLVSLKNFNVELWNDRGIYTLYLLKIIPDYVATFAEVTVGSMLLFKRFRNAQTVNWLRITFVVTFIFGVVGVVIDSAYWPANVVLDCIPLVGLVLFFFYFTRSERVDLVFRQGNWDPNVMYPLAAGTEPKDVSKKWLKVYALVIVAIIVVTLLLIFIKSRS